METADDDDTPQWIPTPQISINNQPPPINLPVLNTNQTDLNNLLQAITAHITQQLTTTIQTQVQEAIEKTLQAYNIRHTTPRQHTNNSHPHTYTSTSYEAAQQQLLYHMEKYYSNLYHKQRYTTYYNIQTPQLSHAVTQLTEDYLNLTLGIPPTNDNILQHHKAALTHTINNTNSKIQWHYNKISQHTTTIREHHATNNLPDPITILDSIKTKALNNTIPTKKYNHNTIFTTAAVAYTHHLHNTSRNITANHPQQPDILNTMQDLVKTLDQITTTKQKHSDITHHIQTNTLPTYLQNHHLPWKGPIMTPEMETLWNQTQHNNNINILKTTLHMLQLQEDHLTKETTDIKTKLPTELLPTVKQLHTLHDMRHHRTTHERTTLPKNFNLIMDQPLTTPYTDYSTLFEDPTFFQAQTTNETPQRTHNHNYNIEEQPTTTHKPPDNHTPTITTNNPPTTTLNNTQPNQQTPTINYSLLNFNEPATTTRKRLSSNHHLDPLPQRQTRPRNQQTKRHTTSRHSSTTNSRHSSRSKTNRQ